MNAIKLKKLEIMKAKVGEMTSDEAIEMAIHFDQIAKGCHSALWPAKTDKTDALQQNSCETVRKI